MKRHKFTKLERREFIATWTRSLIHLYEDLEEWKDAQLQVLEETELTKGFDINSFAKESFLHTLKKFHDHHYDIEAALQETKYLINSE